LLLRFRSVGFLALAVQARPEAAFLAACDARDAYNALLALCILQILVSLFPAQVSPESMFMVVEVCTGGALRDLVRDQMVSYNKVTH